MKDTEKDGFMETIRTIVIALLLAGVIRTLFFQPFWIPSSSMKPTLLVGDFLFVNKMAYGYSQHSCPFSMCSFIQNRIFKRDPERGDIVVFRAPKGDVDFIKRLVGLPGDKIQMKNNILYINNAPLLQKENGVFKEIKEAQGRFKNLPRCKNRPVPIGEECIKDQFTETMANGRSYNILNIGDDLSLDNTLIFTVPPKMYFFMGDNRDNSGDSRAASVGFVPEKNLIGRATYVVFSSAGERVTFFWKWRSDRYFKALQ